ncbi:bifunctional diguanylate cyclase/phosphodiesterase [Vreelandella olivaria]|uniref:bifunctional diguanylate cyclase/phosphodiesterase n=1 Tax=Vreelandella olivaria TaxID=390919 RepID=UPI00201E93F2|nr:EAL domain-containing protein [Halomonas olivaria]
MSASHGNELTNIDEASRHNHHPRSGAVTLYIVALFVMMVLFGWLLNVQYRQEMQAAESRAVARANVVAEWTKGVLGQSEQALFSLAELLAIQGWPQQRDSRVMQRALESLTQYVPLIDMVIVLDADGRAWSSSKSRHIGTDFSDTDFFSSFKHGEQPSKVTPMSQSAEDQRFYLYHGHRLNDANGQFAGLTVSRIVPQIFADALLQMSVDEGESIALVDTNLRVIARNPIPDEHITIGSQVNDPDTQRWLASGEAFQTFTMASPIDGRDRLFYMQRVGEEYPVLAVVGIDTHLLLAGWRQRAMILGLIMGVIALLGAWGLRHYLNRLGLADQLQKRIEEREQARAQAQEREARMDALVNSIQDQIFVFDEQGHFTYIHTIDRQKLFVDSQDILGKHFSEVLPQSLTRALAVVFQRVQQLHKSETFDYPLTIAEQPRYFQSTVSPLSDASGHFSGVLAVTRDITEEKSIQAELRIAAVAFQTHMGILITDANGAILKVNDTFERITGYSEAEVIGKNPRMFSSGQHGASFYRYLWKRVIETGNWEGEIWNQRKDGELFPEWLTISSIYNDEGVLTHYVATISDISERKAAEQEIHQLAFYDPLTGLANRRLFMDRMEAALKEMNRHQRCGVLMLIDIDSFKQINDTLGHCSGDQLLQAIARRLRQMLRDTDTLARLGGDEFAVLIEGVDSNLGQTNRLAEGIARKLLATLSEPFVLADETVIITARIGVAIMRSCQHSVDDYLQQVDMALSQAKSDGRKSLRFFDPYMQAELLARVKLEADLRQAVVSEQWQLYFQPQVNHLGQLTGVEALLRWYHPRRGLVAPGEFIPLLETTGLINEVGEWVLREACRLLSRWATDSRLGELTMSVNISPVQFRDADFLTRVESIFAQAHAPLHRLKLEVTESLFVEAQEDVRDKMLSLKAKEVRFSLDDFGTGYSSLAYLAQLPLDQLKIDKSFVQQVLISNANAAIVESTIALAKSLNLDVIAEGVETGEQQAWLQAHGCYAYQGYLFGRPMTLHDMETIALEMGS